MKRWFLFGLGAMLVLILGLLFYGTYLNHRSEAQIVERMSEQKISLRGAKVQMRSMKPQLVLDTINLYSEKMADAVALIDGRITTVNVQKNQHVVKGQTLFTLTNDSHPIRIRQAEIDIIQNDNELVKNDNELVKAESSLAHAKSEYNRYSNLLAENAVSVEKFEETEALYKEAQVNLKNVHVQREQLLAQKDYYLAQKEQLLLENSYAHVAAPIEGEVLILYRPQGSYVTAGTAMALIGDFKNLYFSMTVEDTATKNLKVGGMAELSFHHADLSKIYDTEYEPGNTGRRHPFTAKIIDITPATNEPASIRKVIWEVDNSAGVLEPQTYSSARLQSFNPISCLTIPTRALAGAALDSVFVVDEEGVIHSRKISTGFSDENYIEVTGGLKAEEVVIVSGTDDLKEGLKVDVIIESGDDVG